MYAVRKVTDDIFYIGADDRRITLFENIHPLKRGVSYNSYVLLDEKTVLFDTVDWSAGRILLENLKHVLSGRDLDYIIVNHVEPDHAASLEEVLLRYPNAKVVGTAKAFQFLDQFGINLGDHEKIEAKNGGTLNFGKHEVTFIGAPMVHWPETMATFDKTSGALFTADAFGSFGTLDGKIFYDEVNDKHELIKEMRRYYTNIVGKYGMSVSALLKKIDAIKDSVKFICPLHGPIWRDKFDFIIDKYAHWSSYEPENRGVLIAFASMYGNTENAVNKLAMSLCEKGVTDITVCDVSSTDVSELVALSFKYSHIVLASVTYNLCIYPPMHHYLNALKEIALTKRTFAVVENGTWAIKSGDLMEEFVTKELKGMKLIGDRVTLLSSLKPDKAENLEALAETIAKDVNNL